MEQNLTVVVEVRSTMVHVNEGCIFHLHLTALVQLTCLHVGNVFSSPHDQSVRVKPHPKPHTKRKRKEKKKRKELM
jgi:hypothetical protein